MSSHREQIKIIQEEKRIPFSVNGNGPRINLGAGWDHTKGMVRVDVAGNPDVLADVRHLPFKDDIFVEVRAFHILEHLPREQLIDTMNEWWRITKIGGAVDIEIPLAPSDLAWADPTHISFFVSGTWDYFLQGGPKEDHRLLYGIRPWKHLRKERMGNNDILGVTMEKVL